MQAALENLTLALESPPESAPGTRSSYLCMAGQYLTWLDGRIPPTEKNTRLYIRHKREEGWGEGSLATLFSALKKLHLSNKWGWKLTQEDRPIRSSEVNAPAFTEEELATLIRNRDKYSDGERFYLALSTIMGPRREELARVWGKKDIKGNEILIHTAKRGPERLHLIPDEIMPVIVAYKPKPVWGSTLTGTFHRICEKGLGDEMKGYGWQSVRRTLNTLGPINLAREGLPLTFWPEYMRRSPSEIGRQFMGSAMASHYTHPEILSTDGFALDRIILAIHPLLPYWREG